MTVYRSEKGSIPLVVLVVFIVLLSITSLTSLLLSEKINIRFSIDKDVKRVYEKESAVELTKQITTQLLVSKEWEVIEGEEVLNASDLLKIEEIVNEETLSFMGIDGNVQVKEASADFGVDDYCQRIEDEEGVFIAYDCLDEKWAVSVELVIERAGELETFQFQLNDWVFHVDDATHTITIQKG